MFSTINVTELNTLLKKEIKIDTNINNLFFENIEGIFYHEKQGYTRETTVIKNIQNKFNYLESYLNNIDIDTKCYCYIILLQYLKLNNDKFNFLWSRENYHIY